MAEPIKSPTSLGKVSLVGAGPGDANLITLRGIQLLASADVVLYDGLVNPEILQHASPNAELICVGKHGHGGMWTQKEIDQRTIAFAKEGKSVVRLKGGDTAIFARTAEEVEQLAALAIPFEIVPGITAALAATAYAGIPLTHRDWASAVAFVTGQLQPSDGSLDADDGIDWKSLASFPGTLVLYMGVTTAHHWSQQLIAAGKSPATPVALVRRISWPDQQVVRCELGNVSETIRSLPGFRPPVISIIGEVVNLTSTMNWFSQRPLFGKRYLIAATPDSGSKLSRMLSELGAQVTLQPAMETSPVVDWTEIDPHLHNLARHTWLVFTSPAGVKTFMDRLFHLGYDARHLSGSKIASVGTGTSEALQQYSLRADRTPQVSGIEFLAPLLIPESPGASILFIRNESGRTEGIELLTSHGAKCVSLNVYEQKPVPAWPSPILEACRDGRWHGILVTSANIAEHACNRIAPHQSQQRWYSISTHTTETLKAHGCTQVVTSSSPNFDSLASTLLRDVMARGDNSCESNSKHPPGSWNQT